MKKSGLLLVAFSLLFFGSSFRQLQSQEKTKEEKERELRMQMEIEAQKKAISEQKKLQELEEDEMELQMDARDQAEDEQDESAKDVRRHRVIIRDLPDGKDFRFNFPGDESWVGFQGIEPFLGYHLAGDVEKSSWVFSKAIKEKTFSKDYSFDVETSSNNVVMSVNGNCKAGEIRIRITMPSGKTYSDIAIDESGNLNWRKSFTMSDEENQDKAGEWKFQIKATKASGSFKIALQTY